MILIGLILLLAMVGCITITLKSSEVSASRNIPSNPLQESGRGVELTAGGGGGISGVNTQGSSVRAQRRLYSTTNNVEGVSQPGTRH